MFDIGLPEMLVIGVLALIVVGPKDLPKTIKMVSSWIRKARMMARDFQSGVDEMVREAELDDVKKQLTDGSNSLKKELEETVGTDLAKDLDLSDDETAKVTSKSNVDVTEVMEPGDSAEADRTAAMPSAPADDDDVMPIATTSPKTEQTS
ncbi:Sec-independent protein translocase protein TatB [Magnetovibrio sp.]|uniref:Sec-independent protein translocase protein TatB n=1 Tax=Magnetovibrio sp. TaxID=2024836 RepID=UPI002F95AAA1